MKKVLSTVVALGCCLYLPTAVLAGGGKKADDSMARELQDLRDQLARQQAEIDMLKGQKAGDPSLSGRVEALEKKKGYVMAGNSFIDQVTLKGDFRVRYEYQDWGFNDGDDVNTEHFRNRFRLGGIWQNKAENWVVGAGVATGSATNPTSTNDTWGTTNSFDHSEFNLDYAYAKHTWNDYSMTLGQMENPHVTTWTMYDPDVRFTGLTLAYGAKEGVFATGSAYGVQERILEDGDNSNTSMMYWGQAGYKGKFSEKGAYTLAAGYHMYDQEFINQNSRQNAADSNKLNEIDPDEYGLSIGDLYGDVTIPAGPMVLKFYGQVWMNFDADGEMYESQATTFNGTSGAGRYEYYTAIDQTADDNDLGWVIGVNSNIEQFHFGVAYAYVEADSLYGYLSDADFGIDPTNKEGIRANIGYDITKNWAVDFNFFYAERIEDLTNYEYDTLTDTAVNLGTDSVDDKMTYQLDVSYKF
jgi:hypothetical protein